ncbi:MAG: MarR family transcriptional regulator [Vallitalea sp.]|jgi:DNA-binding MarR family transcriptional regulator|nr:MarR family transcriptional regulator [Vallitalea sp.]
MKEVITEFMEVSNIHMELMKKTEKIKRKYNGIELYPSEIHTLVSIKDNDEMNMTQIAQRLGVTKGAIFKIIEKLEEKELLSRYKRHDNNKNTYFKLSERGLLAYKGHEKFHKDFFGEPPKEFTKFVAENEEIILNMFEFTKDYLVKHIEKIDNE